MMLSLSMRKLEENRLIRQRHDDGAAPEPHGQGDNDGSGETGKSGKTEPALCFT